jgi:hypothetical protein
MVLTKLEIIFYFVLIIVSIVNIDNLFYAYLSHTWNNSF